MNSAMLADVGGLGVLLLLTFIFGLALAALFLLAVILLEGVVLRILKWGTFLRSLLASLLTNMVSTAVGLILLAILAGGRLDFGLFEALKAPWLGMVSILVSWLLSIGIEGGVLILMKREDGRRNWIAAFIANTASYVLLVVPLSLLLLVKLGRLLQEVPLP